jgi:hypothetical protein
MQNRVSRIQTIVLVVGALVAAALTPAWAARTTPTATLLLSVDPNPATQGGTVTVSGSVTNTSGSTQKFTINYSVTGPCGYSEFYSVNVTLHAGETQSASVSRTVPSCPGNYTIRGTVLSDGTEITSASTVLTVQ